MPLRGMTLRCDASFLPVPDFYSHAPAGHDEEQGEYRIISGISTPMPLRGMTIWGLIK